MADVSFVEQGFEVVDCPDDAVRSIAHAARTCYRSEPKDEGADERLVRSLIRRGHEAMLEFAHLTLRIRCDRGLSHEIVRHRLFSFAQESQRYVNSSDRGFEFIMPEGLTFEQHEVMREALVTSASFYERLTELGVRPEIARYVLPNATATTMCVSGNIREWRHFLKLRCDKHAHPMMRRLAGSIKSELARRVPIVFDDLDVE